MDMSTKRNTVHEKQFHVTRKVARLLRSNVASDKSMKIKKEWQIVTYNLPYLVKR